MNYLKRTVIFAVFLTLMSILSSCEYADGEKESDVRTSKDMKSILEESEGKYSEIIGDYEYPDNPVEQLRSALENYMIEQELPIKIGNVEKIEFEGKEYSQFTIHFTNSNDNMCVVSFFNSYVDYGYEELLDGRENPSFTIGFKDPDNSQDLIIVLTSVIKYLSPDLSFEEAEVLAIEQDETISTDGYSMPRDIGGYQIQTRYTSPHVFVSTPDFEAKLGVTVRALKQIWRGTINVENCYQLQNPQDYRLLELRFWEEGRHPEIVYGDFIVKNVWQKQSYIHGETWVVVDVESMEGKQYSLVLDTWDYPDPYEFGIGEQYTLYIRLNFHQGIIYAVQKTRINQLNSRGQVHPIDYPVVDWRNPLQRIEPEGEGEIYDVAFMLQSQSYGQWFAALSGQGIGEAQWPDDPERENYAFVAWYDNLEYRGTPYTKETPIYQDTRLYAKWQYTGPGGVWPRAGRGSIEGIDEEHKLTAGQKLMITAEGYHMNLEEPDDQRFRWYPVSWRLSDNRSGDFTQTYPFQTTLILNTSGEQILYITYVEEIFDGIRWQETGHIYEAEEFVFQVN